MAYLKSILLVKNAFKELKLNELVKGCKILTVGFMKIKRTKVYAIHLQLVGMFYHKWKTKKNHESQSQSAIMSVCTSCVVNLAVNVNF